MFQDIYLSPFPLYQNFPSPLPQLIITQKAKRGKTTQRDRESYKITSDSDVKQFMIATSNIEHDHETEA